ncbi:hypothetical protein [Spiroplasma endosymbiont of Ammophila pubescens]|uniref:hypothetical protein n=1 Tax=Spiroplasma endosymbiont of Ammophila pubescens TaxID=3066315 RepID=UPI0032B204B1
MAMLYEYSYLNEIVVSLLNNTEYIADEINLAGSRKAGKTYSIDELITLLSCIVLANKDKKIAIYGFRLNSADTAEMQQDIQDALDKVGLILILLKNEKVVIINIMLDLINLLEHFLMVVLLNYKGLEKVIHRKY